MPPRKRGLWERGAGDGNPIWHGAGEGCAAHARLRCDERNSRKVGAVSGSVARKKIISRSCCMCSDEEIRQRREPGAPSSTVGGIRLRGEKSGFEGNGLPLDKRGRQCFFQILDSRKPHRHFGVYDGVNDK